MPRPDSTRHAAIAASLFALTVAHAAAAPPPPEPAPEPRPAPAAAQQPPLGSFVVGADPAIAAVVAAGAEGWNATGAVLFVVQATGCWTGDVWFCVNDYVIAGAVAGFNYLEGNSVYVDPDLLGYFTPAVACHELGHVLGLRWFADGSVYHRSDYASCMTDPFPTVAAPDAIDLANLGVDAAPPVGGTDRPAPPPVAALPDTGTGSASAE